MVKATERVEVVSTTDDSGTVQPGDKGTVVSVSSAGRLHVSWDKGGDFVLIPGEDVWRVIK